jgi:hypothetical protein
LSCAVHLGGLDVRCSALRRSELRRRRVDPVPQRIGTGPLAGDRSLGTVGAATFGIDLRPQVVRPLGSSPRLPRHALP